MHEYLNLSVDWRDKAVPYDPEKRHDSENFGYIELKRKPDLAATVVEAGDEPSFVQALRSINAPSTHYFSVGCEKCYNDNPDGSARPIGFLEVCFNSISLAANLKSYFELFMRLHSRMGVNYDALVSFEWRIQPANFGMVSAKGFTVAVYIKLLQRMPRRPAVAAWRSSVDYLQKFISADIPPNSKAPFFYPMT